jgi:glutaredoxin
MISAPRYQEFDGTGSPENVTVYGLLQCVPCKEAKEFMESTGLAFRYVILEQQKPEVRQELKKTFQAELGARPVFPVLEVNGELTFGFRTEQWRTELAQIDEAER